MNEEVTHREIYDRLMLLESKVDRLEEGTASVVAAFNAASGAFTALEWLAKVAKPILWLGGMAAALGVAWSNMRNHG